jgi:hypothetical protein
MQYLASVLKCGTGMHWPLGYVIDSHSLGNDCSAWGGPKWLRMELLVPAVCSWPSLSQPPTHSPKRDRADVSVGDTLPVATKVNWGDSSTVPPVCVKLCGQGTTVGLADTDIVKVTPTETTTASATRRRCMSRCTLVVRMNEVGMCCTRRCSAVQHATLIKLQPGLDVILRRIIICSSATIQVGACY